MKIYDVGGGPRIRGLWKQYFHEVGDKCLVCPISARHTLWRCDTQVHGAVFMVDSADPGRFEEAAGELSQVASHEMLVGKPLLM